MDKLVFKKFKMGSSAETIPVRIDSDLYSRLKDLSDEAGISITKLTNKLLLFAINNVEIQED